MHLISASGVESLIHPAVSAPALTALISRNIYLHIKGILFDTHVEAADIHE
jgi:hypothetical protein